MSRFSSLLSFFLIVSAVLAQDAGLAGGMRLPSVVTRVAPPDAATAERVITIEGVAELRLPPTRLRVVLSASASGKTASEASVACRGLVDATRKRLADKGIAAADVDVDFIAAVPVYEWQLDSTGDKQIAVERRVGSRAQYNLHVAVADEAAAREAIEAATVVDGIDVITVDYWSEQIAGKRSEALAQALRAAQDKAKVLLAVFPQPPVPINVHEQTTVLQPQQLYQAAQRADEPARYGWRDVPQVPATKPAYVYYRGLLADLDVMSADLPGKRDLHVVATVRLYYAAPERPALPPK
jgi:uncharacterized protein YggE